MNEVPGPESTGSQPPSKTFRSAFQDLFPGLIQDGVLDVRRLSDLLDVDVAGLKDGKERFGLMWAGRQKAIEALQAPSYAALIPDMPNSVNWENAENVFIDGDNLEVLKLMQNAYNDQAKLIYIDPPYNTGSDFVYNDDFSDPKQHYLEVTGQVDAAGNRLVANTEVTGRKHSNWLTMMYPRIALARNLLTQDGSIFVSIGEDELVNLRKLMDEIFGESNFVAQISLITGANQAGDGVLVQKNLEYVLIYARDINYVTLNRIDEVQATDRSLADAPTSLDTRPDMGYTVYWKQETGELIAIQDLDKTRIHLNKEDEVYTTRTDLVEQGYIPIRPGTRNGRLHRWRWGIDTFEERKSEIFVKTINGKNGLYFRQSGHTPPKNYWNFTTGTQDLKALFNGQSPFDYPKGVKLLKYIVRLATDEDSLVIDFFGGSGTTAQAVLEANHEDCGSRRFCLVTLSEQLDESHEGYRMGFRKIPEITLARISKSCEALELENKLRSFKLGPSNFRVSQEAADGELFTSQESTGVAEAGELARAAQVGLSLGQRLDSPFHLESSKYALLGDICVAFEIDNVNGLIDLCREKDLGVLACMEDSFAGKDDVKANLYFACKKANITFKTF